MHFAAKRHVAKSARIVGFEHKFVKRIFEIFRVRDDCAAAVGENGDCFAFLRGHVKFAFDVVDVKSVFFGFDFHAESVCKAHDCKVAKHVVYATARHAEQHDFVRLKLLFCIVDGKFSVACVLVRIVFDNGDVHAFGLLQRVEIAENDVGLDRAYVVAAVTRDDFVGIDFSFDLLTAVENDCNFHVFIITRLFAIATD